jgi:hypothetical protein
LQLTSTTSGGVDVTLQPAKHPSMQSQRTRPSQWLATHSTISAPPDRVMHACPAVQ